jgi:hypothetical protein
MKAELERNGCVAIKLYSTQITQMKQIFSDIKKISVNPSNLCHLCAIRIMQAKVPFPLFYDNEMRFCLIFITFCKSFCLIFTTQDR